eukprot:11354181-Karenia_brevis.AAC.1
MQVEGGRYFLHEHPKSATSWNLECIQEVSILPGVDMVVAHMFQFGMKSEDELGVGKVLKPTRFMSNSPAILEQLNRTCQGGHRH